MLKDRHSSFAVKIFPYAVPTDNGLPVIVIRNSVDKVLTIDKVKGFETVLNRLREGQERERLLIQHAYMRNHRCVLIEYDLH